MKKYIWNLLIAIDQLANTVFGGDPDETISSRIGKWARDGKTETGIKHYVYRLLNGLVNFFEKDHFKKSIEDDEGDREVLR